MTRAPSSRPLIPATTLAIALVVMSALALVDANLNTAGSSGAAATETTVAAAGTPEGTPSANDATPVAGGNEAMVAIDDFLFEPAALEIAVGTTVTWTNLGGVPHVATGRNGQFDSRNLFTAETFSYTFEEPGTFDYFCRYHPRMTGTIVVND